MSKAARRAPTSSLLQAAPPDFTSIRSPPLKVGAVVEIDMSEEDGLSGSLYQAEVIDITPGKVEALYFELFDDGDDGEVEVAKPGETEEGQEGRRERGFVRTSRVRPQQTPDITLQLLNQRGSLTGALPLATPQEAASLAASCGFYTPGTPVDVWVRDGWWMAHIVREVAPEAVVDSRSSKPSSTGRRCASDVALAQISPGGRAWQATIDPDRMLTLDIKDGALDRIFEVRYVGGDSDEPSTMPPDVGRLEGFVPALRVRPGATWSRQDSTWNLRTSKTMPPIVQRRLLPSTNHPSVASNSRGIAKGSLKHAARTRPTRTTKHGDASSTASAQSSSSDGDDDSDEEASDDESAAGLRCTRRGGRGAIVISDSSSSEGTRDAGPPTKISSHRDSDRNYCECCKASGALVSCMGCPRAFHAECFVPSLALSKPAGPLFCPACVIGATTGVIPTDCCAGCGLPPPRSPGLTAVLPSAPGAKRGPVTVSAAFMVRCTSCNAGYLPCCLVSGFGPKCASEVASVGATDSQQRSSRGVQSMDLRCLRCAVTDSAGSNPVEALLAHRLRFIRNKALDSTLGLSLSADHAAAGSVAKASTNARVSAEGTISGARKGTMVDCTYLPQLQFLVKWKDRSHWHDSWEALSLVKHVGPQTLRNYLMKNGLTSTANDLALAAFSGVVPRALHKVKVVVRSDDHPRLYAPEEFLRAEKCWSSLSLAVLHVPWSGTCSAEQLQPAAFSSLASCPGLGCALPVPHLVAAESQASTGPVDLMSPRPLEMMAVPQYLDVFECREGDSKVDDVSSDDSDSNDEAVNETSVGARVSQLRSVPIVASASIAYSSLPAEGIFRPEHLVVDRVLAVRRPKEGSYLPWKGCKLAPELLDLLQRLRLRATVAAPPALHDKLGLSLTPSPSGHPSQPACVGQNYIDANLLRYDPAASRLVEAIERRGSAYGGMEMLVRFKGCNSAQASWEAGPLVAAVAPHAVMHFFRVNGRCLYTAVEVDRYNVDAAALASSCSLHEAGAATPCGVTVSASSATASSAGPSHVDDESRNFFHSSPSFLNKTLFPYQLEGLNWLLNRNSSHIGCCLADEMGLGKTVQAIALISAVHHLARTRQADATKLDPSSRVPGMWAGGVSAGPHVVIVPKITLGNWEREFATWAPGLVVVTHSGLEKEREATKSFEWFVTDENTGDVLKSPGLHGGIFPHVVFDVLLTSYETVTLDLSSIRTCLSALEAHGGRQEFLARRDRLDVHIDGLGAKDLPPLPMTAASDGLEGKKRKRTAIPPSGTDAFSHLIPPASRGGFESWGVVCVDEGHRLRNSDAVLFATLTSNTFKHARHRVVMTGTPIQNNLNELFTVMSWLSPDRFNDEEAFSTRFGALTSASSDLRNEFSALLRPHVLRRTKDDVLKMLPARHEVLGESWFGRLIDAPPLLTLANTPLKVPVPLAAAQAEIYKLILTKNYELLHAAAASDKSRTPKKSSLGHCFMQLRKAANHPYLVEGAEAELVSQALAAPGADKKKDLSAADEYRLFCEASGKLTLLRNLLPRLISKGHRVLIFSFFKIVLDLIEDLINGMVLPDLAPGVSCPPAYHPRRRLLFGRIDGDTDLRTRQRLIDSFNAPMSKLAAMLMTTRAGGQGVNLATADTVIIMDCDWNPHVDRQAIARAHRIGQTRSVVVFRLVAEHTVEERIIDLAAQKLKLEHLAIRDVRGNKPTLTAEDIQQVLAFGANKLFATPLAPDGSSVSGHVWDAPSVDALIDKSVTEAQAETLRKHAAAVAGKDYGGGVADIFSGLTRWELDKTDASALAAEAEWRTRFERWQEQRRADAQAKEERLGKGFRLRQPVVPAPAPKATSVSGDDENDEEYDVAEDDTDSLEEDDEYVIAPIKLPAPMTPLAQPVVPLESRTDPDGILKHAFTLAIGLRGLDAKRAAAACGLKAVVIFFWLDPQTPRSLPREACPAVFKWVSSIVPKDIVDRMKAAFPDL